MLVQDRDDFSREHFCKKYEYKHVAELLAQIEKRVPDFWDRVVEIRNHYLNSMDTYKNVVSRITSELIIADTSAAAIHSVRSRVKDVDSLLVKIIEKSASVPMTPQDNLDIEKYRDISAQNYHKIITDLVGVRILIRYRYQWSRVHDLVWGLYHSEKGYISDWVGEYTADPALKYIVEQPKAYVKERRDGYLYKSIGENVFRILDSDNHYASVHYVINYCGAYVELQVRTIFDEAWCECNHDFVYKPLSVSEEQKKIIERLTEMLAKHTTVSEEIVSLVCNIALPKLEKQDADLHDNTTDSTAERMSKVYSSLLDRANLLVDEQKE